MARTTTLELPDEVYGRLSIRAAENGRTPAAEAREIVLNALAENPRFQTPDRNAKAVAAIEALQDDIDAWFGARKPAGMADALIAERRAEAVRRG